MTHADQLAIANGQSRCAPLYRWRSLSCITILLLVLAAGPFYEFYPRFPVPPGLEMNEANHAYSLALVERVKREAPGSLSPAQRHARPLVIWLYVPHRETSPVAFPDVPDFHVSEFCRTWEPLLERKGSPRVDVYWIYGHFVHPSTAVPKSLQVRLRESDGQQVFTVETRPIVGDSGTYYSNRWWPFWPWWPNSHTNAHPASLQGRAEMYCGAIVKSGKTVRYFRTIPETDFEWYGSIHGGKELLGVFAWPRKIVSATRVYCDVGPSRGSAHPLELNSGRAQEGLSVFWSEAHL